MIRVVVEIFVLGLLFFLEGVYPLYQGRADRFRHAGRNIAIGILNGFITAFIFAAFTRTVMEWSSQTSFGLLHHLGVNTLAKGILGFLLFDLWMYGWHVANHKIPLLWRFHRMHHSDLELDTTSALRFHPGEIVFSSLLRLIIIPLLGVTYIQLFIYELCLQPVILFHHSNVALPEKVDRFLRTLVVTPNMHRVHHSQMRQETDSNYSSIFSFWDRIAGTFRKRQDTRTLQYGLSYLREDRWQNIPGLLKTPFFDPATGRGRGA